MSQRRARRERQQHGAAAPSRRPRPAWVRPALAAAMLVVLGALAATLSLARGTTATTTSSIAGQAAAASASVGSPLELSGTDPVTGKPVSLAAYADKPIVLNMWASWCTGCYAEARALATSARTHPQAQVVGVDIQDTKTAAKAFYRRFGWRHPSIFDPSGSIAAQLGLCGCARRRSCAAGTYPRLSLPRVNRDLPVISWF